MRVYYAHCMALYNTPQERRDVLHLECLGFEVVNPNSPAINLACENIRRDTEVGVSGNYTLRGNQASLRIMLEIFQPLVMSCDCLAFRALPGGALAAGVYKEINWMCDKMDGAGVFELPRFYDRQILTVEQTRDYLREVGQR